METISCVKALRLILSSKGRIFGIEFIKKNGEKRRMSARVSVSKNVKGVQDRTSQDIAHDLITVFDMNTKVDGERGGFRRIQINTITYLKIKGQEYKVK